MKERSFTFFVLTLVQSLPTFLTPMTNNHTNSRPIIGLTTYRKTAAQATPLPVMALMPTYIDAVAAAGGVPVLIPLGIDEEALRTLLASLDGLVLTGGGDFSSRNMACSNARRFLRLVRVAFQRAAAAVGWNAG